MVIVWLKFISIFKYLFNLFFIPMEGIITKHTCIYLYIWISICETDFEYILATYVGSENGWQDNVREVNEGICVWSVCGWRNRTGNSRHRKTASESRNPCAVSCANGGRY